MTCGIYKIKNMINGKVYVGQSVDIEQRWRQHTQYCNNDNRNSSHLYKSMKKYGIDNFEFSIICEVPESSLDQYEISYIKYYETTNSNKGYNKTHGGANGRLSEETKKKISAANKGKKRTEEEKQKMSNIQKNRSPEIAKRAGLKLRGRQSPNKGVPHTEEAKQKIKIARSKQIITEEHKQNMSKAQKGRKHSEETKKKIGCSNKGKVVSNETKLKMSNQYIYNDIIYNGMRELANYLGITVSSLEHKIFRKQIDVTIIKKGK